MIIFIAIAGFVSYVTTCYFEGREHNKQTKTGARNAYALSMLAALILAILTGLTVLGIWVTVNPLLVLPFMILTALLWGQYNDLILKEDSYSAYGGTVPL